MEERDLKYLKTMARQYPTIASAATEIINLQAILSLPKGTEHFMTDIHGEYEQFQHILKNGSGAIKRKIQDEFGNAFSVGMLCVTVPEPYSARLKTNSEVLLEFRRNVPWRH